MTDLMRGASYLDARVQVDGSYRYQEEGTGAWYRVSGRAIMALGLALEDAHTRCDRAAAYSRWLDNFRASRPE